MFSTEEYAVGWLMYVLGAGLVFYCCNVLFMRIRTGYIRLPLQITIATFLFFPWTSSENSSFWSPAWMASALETLFDGSEALARAGVPLLVALIFSFILALVIAFFRSDSTLDKA